MMSKSNFGALVPVLLGLALLVTDVEANDSIPEASRLRLVRDDSTPPPGTFTVTVTIETETSLPAQPAPRQGFWVKQCSDSGDVAGVVGGKVGLTFTPGSIDFQGATLGGAGPSVHFPASIFQVSSEGEGWVRLAFAVPTPPDGTLDADQLVHGAGAIATFTFRVADATRSFVLGLDPENTSFPIGSTNPAACSIDVPEDYPAGEWPIAFPTVGRNWIPRPLGLIEGAVELWSCSAPIPVPFTMLTLNTNPKRPDQERLTRNNDATGAYLFEANLDQNYQLSGSKPGKASDGVFRSDKATDFRGRTDVARAITATDVGQILLYANDPTGFPLTACAFEAPDCGGTIYPQRVAANVNGWMKGGDCPLDPDADVISVRDAYILQEFVAQRIKGKPALSSGYPLYESNPCASNWQFFCANVDLGTIPSSGIVYNPVGVLIGDVNGSYHNYGNMPLKSGRAASTSSPSIHIAPLSIRDRRVIAPVVLHDADSIVGIEAKLLYDERALRFVSVRAPVSQETNEPENHAWGSSDGDGILALIVTGLARPLEGTSTVAFIEFEPTSEARGTYAILIAEAFADDQPLTAEPGVYIPDPRGHATWGDVKKLYR